MLVMQNDKKIKYNVVLFLSFVLLFCVNLQSYYDEIHAASVQECCYVR